MWRVSSLGGTVGKYTCTMAVGDKCCMCYNWGPWGGERWGGRQGAVWHRRVSHLNLRAPRVGIRQKTVLGRSAKVRACLACYQKSEEAPVAAESPEGGGRVGWRGRSRGFMLRCKNFDFCSEQNRIPFGEVWEDRWSDTTFVLKVCCI